MSLASIVSGISPIRACDRSELATRCNLYRAVTLTSIQLPRSSSGQAPSMMEDFAHQVLSQGMDYEWTGLSYQKN